MSYCVNCGVKLPEGCRECPLCQTPVIHPDSREIPAQKPFFATRKETVAPVSKKELALLLSAMLASVCLCCGLINLAVRPDLPWSLYVMGAAGMLWLCFTPPLIWRPMPAPVRISLCFGAAALYVLLIAFLTEGIVWYFHLALPVLLCGWVAAMILWGTMGRGRRSTLSSIVIVLTSLGLYSCVVEAWIDLYRSQNLTPGWSLIVLAVCLGLSLPFLVIRFVPGLREEARRRFHL